MGYRINIKMILRKMECIVCNCCTNKVGRLNKLHIKYTQYANLFCLILIPAAHTIACHYHICVSAENDLPPKRLSGQQLSLCVDGWSRREGGHKLCIADSICLHTKCTYMIYIPNKVFSECSCCQLITCLKFLDR